jgi:CheY-like chemotaxis protein
VDDDNDDQEIFKEIVAHINPAIVCHIASNGSEALHLLEKSISPAMIFLDVNMPQMDGKELLKTIRQNSAYTAVSIVMFSTSYSTHYATEYKALGADGYIQKPSSFFEAIERLKPWIEKSTGTPL